MEKFRVLDIAQNKDLINSDFYIYKYTNIRCSFEYDKILNA